MRGLRLRAAGDVDASEDAGAAGDVGAAGAVGGKRFGNQGR